MYFTDPIAVGSILGRPARIPAKTNLSEERAWQLGSTDRIVISIELATVNVRATLEIRF
jgi:hypothetical protein